MTAEQRELLASFLVGPVWQRHAEPSEPLHERVCTACGRTTCCAPDCAPYCPLAPR